jgi:hypothetical protein
VKKKDWANLSQVMMALSVVAVALAGVGYMGTDIWLASTQWVIVAAVLALFGIYSRMSSR